MKNVLSLVSYPILPALVGGQKGIALFYKYFSRHVNLTCVTTKRNDARAAEGYEVLNILSNHPFRYINIFYFFTLRRLIKKKNITHLLIEHPYYGWLGVMLKTFTGTTLIVHSHNIEGLRWKTLGKWWWKILLQYEGWVHRNADLNFFKQNEDLNYAITMFKLNADRCLEVTYGIEIKDPPTPEEKAMARKHLLEEYNIPADHRLLFFNGAFNYPPNLAALNRIVDDIYPRLLMRDELKFSILLCGKDIPETLSAKKQPRLFFAGFVPDISLYFKGADIFLNTVVEGGGIKTKLVEALGYDMNAISTQNGAIGIDPAICNNKLMVVPNDVWEDFVTAIIRTSGDQHISTPFFDHFYWGNIANRASAFINENR